MGLRIISVLPYSNLSQFPNCGTAEWRFGHMLPFLPENYTVMGLNPLVSLTDLLCGIPGNYRYSEGSDREIQFASPRPIG